MAQNEITELISSFKTLMGVGICFYDTERFFGYHTTGKKENTGHYCEFCNCAKLLEGGRAACDKCHRNECTELAKSYRSPFFYKCHLGICELVVPVIKSEKLIGLIFIGQCRIEGEDASREVCEGAMALGGNPEIFLSLYNDLPIIKRSDMLAVGNLFTLYFSKLGDSIDFFGKSGISMATDATLSKKIANHIEYNYSREISTKTISEQFYLSESHISRVFKKEMKLSITDYIRKVRIEHAGRLLSATSIPINSIALNVGYHDANYFSRIFTKETGLSPSKYRNKKER